LAQLPQRQLTIAGRTVLEDGPVDGTVSSRDTVVLLHGWPDTLRLWDGTVAALAGNHRCLRFTMPGFDAADPPGAHTLAAVTDLLHQVVRHAGGGQPVTLVLHDWGCFFGYHFAQQHPELVARVVGIDIGDAASAELRRALSVKAKLAVLGYQGWLAAAWRIGGALGNRMARKMAQLMRVPTPAADIRAAMGYPYWIAWTGSHGGFRAVRTFRPGVPMFFAYGQRKPFMFHSPVWADAVAAQPHGKVQGYRAGHWVMLDAHDEFHADLTTWLAQTA
jgi:pimeloyl-ACP methyl ester carboxylesterase